MNRNNQLRYVLILSVFLMLFVSCFGDKNTKRVKAAVVDYNINWNTNNANKVDILPKNFKLMYSEKGFCLEFDKMLSFIGMRIVHEFKNDSLNYILDMSSIGSYFGYPVKALRSNFKNLEYKSLKETKSILDYKCNAIQYMSKDKKNTIKIFYSKDLNIDVINRLIPEIKFKGAILGIQIMQNNDCINIFASRINEQDVDSDLFIVPDNFIKNSFEQLSTTLNNLVQ